MILRFQHVLDSNYFIKNPLNVFDLKLWLELTWLLIQPVFKQKKEILNLVLFMVWKEIWKYALIWLWRKRIITVFLQYYETTGFNIKKRITN